MRYDAYIAVNMGGGVGRSVVVSKISLPVSIDEPQSVLLSNNSYGNYGKSYEEYCVAYLPVLDRSKEKQRTGR